MNRAFPTRYVLAAFAAAMLNPAAAWAESPAVLYVISTHHQTHAGPDELVRIVEGQIIERTPLGWTATYGASDRQLAIVGAPGGQWRLRMFELSTGELSADVKLENMQVGFLRPHRGVSNTLLVGKAEGQVLYSGVGSRERIEVQQGRKVVQTEKIWPNAAIDWATGRITSVEASAVAPHASWQIVAGKPGLRMIDGSFATYSPRLRAIDGVMRFEGIAREWSGYLPGIGLTRSTGGEFQLISDAELRPLASPLALEAAHGARLQSHFRRLADGRLVRYTLSRVEVADRDSEPDDVQQQVCLAAYDLTAQQPLWERTFPFEASTFHLDGDAAKAFLIDHRARRAWLADLDQERATEWDVSWTGEAAMIPFFGK